jgi:hypothetical protein
MVTHDWGGNRAEILDRVDEILESEWAKNILRGVRLDEVGRPIIERKQCGDNS